MAITGIPIVLSTKGTPVTMVENLGIYATIAKNGLGIPVTIVPSGGTPMIIDGAEEWTPEKLNPDAWFDPSDSNTVFVGRTGTVPATAGSPVGQIIDKSGKGNHAVAPTDAARPTLARMPKTGRRNLLTYTEDFSNTYWVKSGVFLNTPTKLTESATNAVHKVHSQFIGNQGVYTAFFDVSAAERSLCEIWVGNTPPSIGAGTRFNLQNGTVVNSRTVGGSLHLNSGVINLGGGIFRCYVTMENTGTQPMLAHLFIIADGLPNNTITYQGDGASGINVYRSQMELGLDATPYQKVTNAFDVTEAGVPDVWYLEFDGVDDVLNVVLPKAINGFILIAGTKGTIIEPVSYAAGSTLSIGTTTYTGGTAGILSAVGGIVGVNLFDRNLTELERGLLIGYYKGNGAKGILVPGPELVADPDFNAPSQWSTGTSWTVSDGKASITGSLGSGDRLSPVVSPDEGPVGKLYQLSVGIQSSSAGVNVAMSRALIGAVPFLGTGVQRQVRVKSSAGSGGVAIYVPAGNSAVLDNVSVRELRPQEDWT